MIPERPEIAGFRAGCPPRLLQGFVEVERLHVLALLAHFEAPEQVAHLVLAEAREREVDVGRGLQVSEETGQEGIVPGTGDLVERQPEEPSLLH